ncbi:ryncolin-4-like [Musca autumnalis]|uniref:ryncolin-4-like n=1 Tax=Musca autumnalis TaxID=221902 RepID=UPI003CF52D74
MKVIFTVLLLNILLASYEAANNTTTSEEVYNPLEDEHSLFLWRNSFIKENTFRLNEQQKQMDGILKENQEITTVFKNVLNEQERQMEGILKENQEITTVLNKQEKQMNGILTELQEIKTELKTVQHEQETQLNEILKHVQEGNDEFKKIQNEQKWKINDMFDQIKGISNKIVDHTEEMELVNQFKMGANGQWTTILRRMDGSVDFYRNWYEYKTGFGNPPHGEFFIGLKKLHLLTTAVPDVELKIILKTWDYEERYAFYDGFQIGNEMQKYRIKYLGTYNGNAGDKMRYHFGRSFSTFDEDNDNAERSCANKWKGAWWFGDCFYSHLFGPYRQKEKANTYGIVWNNPEWKGEYYSFKYAVMLLRPKVAK